MNNTDGTTPICRICRTFGKSCCKLHKDAPRFRADCKLLCGEHPAFVDSFSGQHPMHNGPVPYAGEDDPTVLEHRSVA
jgi:hypothetical protein